MLVGQHQVLDPRSRQSLVAAPTMLHAALALGGVSYNLSTDLEESVVRAIEQLFFPAWDKLEPI